MYLINTRENNITKVEQKSFEALELSERYHLQEWLAKTPDALGEPILIIQKEFSGWDNTNERLDLLGIDKNGNLVVIENKRDDSGKDVTWQALKYAAYCSTLTNDGIKQIYKKYLNNTEDDLFVEEKIKKFLEKDDDFKDINLNEKQRIILVAANFRPEVTSAVLWLNDKYNLEIQCIKVTPYLLKEQILLDIEQFIPLKETKDYQTKLAIKNQEDKELKTRHSLRIEFWTKLLAKTKENGLKKFENISAIKEAWIGRGSGIGGVSYQFGISRSYARVLISIAKGSKEINDKIFNELYKKKDEIEKVFGERLEWHNKEENNTSCIYFEKTDNADYFKREYWEEMMDFMIDGMIKLEKAFEKPIEELKKIKF